MARLWMKVDPALPHSEKLVATADELNVSCEAMVGHLISLWGWAVHFAENGEVGHLQPGVLAHAAGWRKRAATFMDALWQFGWIDPDGRFHEWDEWAGAYAAQLRKDRERKSGGSSKEVPRKPTGTSATVPPLEVEVEVEEPVALKRRKQDLLWDAFVEAAGRAPQTKSERGKWNTGLKELREAESPVTPEEVPALHAAYIALGWQSFSPMSVAGQLSKLRAPLEHPTDPEYPPLEAL